MGLSARELDLIIALTKAGRLRPGGSIVEIGAQQLSNDFLRSTRQIDDLGHLFGIRTRFDLPPASDPQYSATGLELQPDNAPRSDSFWRWLGFNYAAVDVDNSPGTIPLDLNFDGVPPENAGRYDLVVNAGTTEHVANQLNAMKVIHELTKVEGIMIHQLPAQGFHNHGLFNYNLKFFWMLARSNLYEWIVMDFEANETMRPIDLDVLTTLSAYGAESVTDLEAYRANDCAMTIAMKKVIDIEFIPPLDVRTGAGVDNQALRERYWTVFDIARVERVLQADRVGRQVGK